MPKNQCWSLSLSFAAMSARAELWLSLVVGVAALVASIGNVVTENWWLVAASGLIAAGSVRSALIARHKLGRDGD
jgi:hypothetical protein